MYFLFFVAMSLFLWLCQRDYPDLPLFVSLSRPFWKPHHGGLSVRLDYLTSIWVIQATLAGLVYPIVLSFVTILLQRRSNAKVPLHIYLADSAAIVSGLSALALVGVIALQYLFVSVVPLAVLPLWTLLDGFAFLFNLFLTVHFLYRTFEFVRLDKRGETIQRYVINVAWPLELRRHLVEPQLSFAIEKMATGGFFRRNGYTISYDPLGRATGMRIAKFEGKDGRELNVRFWVLRCLMALWQWWAWARNAWYSIWRHPTGQGTQTLVLSAVRRQGLQLSGLAVHQDGADNLRPWKMLRPLLNWTFSFKRSTIEQEKLTVHAILSDMQAEVILALQSEEMETLHERLSDITDMYKKVVGVSTIKRHGATEEVFSPIYDYLTPAALFMKVPVYKTWGDVVVDTFERTATYIEKGGYRAKEAIVQAHRLAFELVQNPIYGPIVRYALDIPTRVLYGAQAWWVRKVEEEGDAQHGTCCPRMLHPPLSESYLDVLRSFVGHWEALKQYGLVDWGKQNIGWDKLQIMAPELARHLHNTAVMALVSVYRGDAQAAEMAVDMLQKWFGAFREREGESYFLPGRFEWTFEMMSQPWSEANPMVATKRTRSVPGYDEEGLPEAVFWAVLENFYVDVCYSTVVGLLYLGKDCKCEDSLAARLTRALVLGNPLESGNERFVERGLRQPSTLFFSIWRRYYGAGSAMTGYSGRLASIVQEAEQRREIQRTTGRVYTSVAFESSDSWSDGFLVLIVWLVSIGGIPSLAQESRFREWVERNGLMAKRFGNVLRGWRDRLNAEEFRSVLEAFTCLFPTE
jgi:hypothetical protein